MGPCVRRDDIEYLADHIARNDGEEQPHATIDSFGRLATTDWLRPPAFAA
jgi:hypothetical protein